ncbi:MAG: L,D-transpeptidase [Anaerolineales bacterium]
MAKTPRNPERISRRQFLGLSAFQMLALAPPLRWAGSLHPSDPGDALLGRVLDPTADVFRRPSFSSEKVKLLWQDDVVALDEALMGDHYPDHNRIWYKAPNLGFLHSASLQPVHNRPNEPLARIPYGGMLMETTIPYVDALWKPKLDAELAYRYYYSSTCWVIGVVRDSRARRWYHIHDDKYDYHFYAPAEALRPIPLAELTPIAADVPAAEKRIEVLLGSQWVECYEGADLVFSARASTGRLFADGGYATPEGEFSTFWKRASRHMSAGNRASGYDLVGVPWVSYLTEDGISLHGTYWHNDFGVPRSHGCINLTAEAAKWIYRWTLPVVPTGIQQAWEDSGTRVTIRS